MVTVIFLSMDYLHALMRLRVLKDFGGSEYVILGRFIVYEDHVKGHEKEEWIKNNCANGAQIGLMLRFAKLLDV